LRPGDRLLTLQGPFTHRVRWLGCWRASPATTVRITANALAPGMPHTDLVVSPDHAIFVQGVLIPARILVNGATIRAEQVPAMTWWHVELDRHAIILAAGLPAESYLETANR